ncbi:hypothetical protein OM076_40385, partial [Solirubrobacter ginsenosidimutans]
MTRDPIQTLTAADPFRDSVPTAAESSRMDAELHRLLALATAEERTAPPHDAAPRDVVAAQDVVGPRGDTRRRRAAGPPARRRAATPGAAGFGAP